ncbi:ROK family protein [soil metagenome]
MQHVWGIDLGGTKIEGVVLERSGDVVARLRVPTEADKGYDHILGQIENLVSLLQKETSLDRPERIGMGTPGTTDPTSGRMKNCNTTALNGRTLQQDISAKLGSEVLLANDANCFALAEATLGAGKGMPVVFGMILGTGVGGGIVVNGHALGGAQGIAGEWGHNELEPGGEACYCGKVGCVETVLSGPYLEKHYAKLSGKKLSLKEIAASTETDDAAKATIDRLVTMFGKAASVVINILDPDAIILGGGVGNIAALNERAAEAMLPWVFNPTVDTKILLPELGDSAGVFGAAMLLPHHQ